MRSVLLKNVYGYPALSDTIQKYAEARGYRLVLSQYNLKVEDEDTRIVISGLPFLKSTNIPIIGYQMYDNGAWYKTKLPSRLKSNEVHMKLPKFHAHPSHEELYDLFVNNKVSDNMSSRFTSYHALQDLNERVFKVGPDEKKAKKEIKDE